MAAIDEIILVSLILIPLIAAIVAMVFPKDNPKPVWYFAIAVSALTCLLSIIAFLGYDYSEGGYQFSRTYDWIGDPVNISLALAIEGIAAP